MQQMQEMASDGVIVGFHVDALILAREMMPVDEHRTQRGDELGRSPRTASLCAASSVCAIPCRPPVAARPWMRVASRLSTCRTVAGSPRSVSVAALSPRAPAFGSCVISRWASSSNRTRCVSRCRTRIVKIVAGRRRAQRWCCRPTPDARPIFALVAASVSASQRRCDAKRRVDKDFS